jgi:hypothetical protein
MPIAMPVRTATNDKNKMKDLFIREARQLNYAAGGGSGQVSSVKIVEKLGKG